MKKAPSATKPVHPWRAKLYRSKCCGAKVYAIGKDLRVDMDVATEQKSLAGKTFHAQCDKCRKPCNVK